MFKGKTFCITGKLENFHTKKEAWLEIAHHGGNTVDSLNYDCDYLILGALGNDNYAYGSKGRKQEKAESMIAEGYQIRIITENQLLTMLENAEEVPLEQHGVIVEKSKSGNPTGLKPQIMSTEVETPGGTLHISEGYSSKITHSRQILRILFQSSPVCKEIAITTREKLKELKTELRQLGCKNSVRTEILPVNWGISIIIGLEDIPFPPKKVEDNEECLMSSKILVAMSTSSIKSMGGELAEKFKHFFVQQNLGGELSIRIWDEGYRYGKYWLNRLDGKM